MYQGAEGLPSAPVAFILFFLFVPDTPERKPLFPGKFIRWQTCFSALMGL
jgi:hypothetical protein